jgi:ubiquinone/menaquinone biosynthesis C-methylase UbiE
MPQRDYIMESDEESLRLDLKTDPDILKKQALWAGLKPGMRVADLGCGSGKTTFYLNELVQPKGAAVGFDISPQRIEYAQTHYLTESTQYVMCDIREPIDHLEEFDFIWMRFVLEHYRKNSFEIVKNIASLLKPGGILCLADLDYNCLTHFGLPPKLEQTLFDIMEKVAKYGNFDPYAGRKLYAYLYDLKFEQLEVQLAAHHLIFGELDEVDKFNWMKKIDIAAKSSRYSFDSYPGGFEGFRQDFATFFKDPRRFTYTPLIICKGHKPA